jgi:hypothetical protein
MKKALLLLFVFMTYLAQAQDSASVKKDTSYWKKTVKVGFNMNQASFSDNWKGGGVNSVAYLIFLNATADYAKNKISFNNLLDLQFGSINNKNSGYFKNVDRIYFDSKVGYALSKSWNMFVAVNFLSQFYDGFNIKKKNGVDTTYYISNFMSPGYLTESFGLEYKPVTWFYVRFGVGAARQTFVTARGIDIVETKNYGVDPGQTVRNEMAFMLQSGLDKDLHKNINLKARYVAFANHQVPDKIKNSTNITWFDYIDHRLDATLTAKITKYITTSLNGTLLYDYDQDRDAQYAQSLGLGILFTF